MRLALGAVQFGLDYGISNTAGRTPFDEVLSILDCAAESGIETIDTAAAYGDSEEVLARARAQARGFRIISKTARLSEGLDAIVARARRSVDLLGRPLDALMIHSAPDLLAQEGERLWTALRALQAAGDVRRLGISFYARDPILDIAERFAPEVVQLPVSLIDQRLIRNGVIAGLAKRGIEVHARSAFHQGLIFVGLERLPPRLRERRETIAAIQERMRRDGRSPLQLALSFLGACNAIHAVVVGVTKRAELEDIVAAAREPWPGLDAADFATDDPVILDPTNW